MTHILEYNPRWQKYILAAFRSRQHTLRYEALLKSRGITVEVVSTPQEAAVGCGLSLRFHPEDLTKVVELWRNNRPDTLAGIYLVEFGEGRRTMKSVRVFSAKT